VNRVLATGLRFPEGPSVGRDGRLYFVEMGNARVPRIAEDGRVETFSETGGGPNGSAFGPDGALYVCDNGARWPAAPSTDGLASPPAQHVPGRIVRVTPDGVAATFLAEVDGAELAQPNDLCFDDHGGFYFTNPVWPDDPDAFLEEFVPGDICYAVPDSNGDCARALRCHTGIAYPNGIGVSPDGATLLVACSFTGRLIAFPILAPGELREPRDYAHLGNDTVPDGFCFDVTGRVICAGAMTQAFHVFPPGGGDKEAEIPVEGQTPTNVCFGGPDFRTLFMTESGSGRIVATQWQCPGHVLFPDRPENDARKRLS